MMIIKLLLELSTAFGQHDTSDEYQMNTSGEGITALFLPLSPFECNASYSFLKRLILIEVFSLKNEVAIL